MDPARSDFGTGPVSESRLDKIGIEGVNLKDTITQKLRRGDENTYDMIYTLDGKECTNHVRGNLVKSTAQWEGDELVIDSKVFALRQAIIEDRWSLSADGKTHHLAAAHDRRRYARTRRSSSTASRTGLKRPAPDGTCRLSSGLDRRLL